MSCNGYESNYYQLYLTDNWNMYPICSMEFTDTPYCQFIYTTVLWPLINLQRFIAIDILIFWIINLKTIGISNSCTPYWVKKIIYE